MKIIPVTTRSSFHGLLAFAEPFPPHLCHHSSCSNGRIIKVISDNSSFPFFSDSAFHTVLRLKNEYVVPNLCVKHSIGEDSTCGRVQVFSTTPRRLLATWRRSSTTLCLVIVDGRSCRALRASFTSRLHVAFEVTRVGVRKRVEGISMLAGLVESNERDASDVGEVVSELMLSLPPPRV